MPRIWPRDSSEEREGERAACSRLPRCSALSAFRPGPTNWPYRLLLEAILVFLFQRTSSTVQVYNALFLSGDIFPICPVKVNSVQAFGALFVHQLVGSWSRFFEQQHPDQVSSRFSPDESGASRDGRATDSIWPDPRLASTKPTVSWCNQSPYVSHIRFGPTHQFIQDGGVIGNVDRARPARLLDLCRPKTWFGPGCR